MSLLSLHAPCPATFCSGSSLPSVLRFAVFAWCQNYASTFASNSRRCDWCLHWLVGCHGPQLNLHQWLPTPLSLWKLEFHCYHASFLCGKMIRCCGQSQHIQPTGCLRLQEQTAKWSTILRWERRTGWLPHNRRTALCSSGDSDSGHGLLLPHNLKNTYLQSTNRFSK